MASSDHDESNSNMDPLLRNPEELPTTYISRNYYAPGIVRSPLQLRRLEYNLIRLYSIDKVMPHASLEDVIVVKGYTPEFEPERVLASIQKLDPRARFYN